METILVLAIRVIIVFIAFILIIRGYIKHKQEEKQKRFDLECEKYYNNNKE